MYTGDIDDTQREEVEWGHGYLHLTGRLLVLVGAWRGASNGHGLTSLPFSLLLSPLFLIATYVLCVAKMLVRMCMAFMQGRGCCMEEVPELEDTVGRKGSGCARAGRP